MKVIPAEQEGEWLIQSYRLLQFLNLVKWLKTIKYKAYLLNIFAWFHTPEEILLFSTTSVSPL